MNTVRERERGRERERERVDENFVPDESCESGEGLGGRGSLFIWERRIISRCTQLLQEKTK